MVMMLTAVLLASSPGVGGTRVGTAQDMTFAILMGAFVALNIVMLFWLRSGHERARRRAVVQEQRAREQAMERTRVLEAHQLPPRHGEDLPR